MIQHMTLKFGDSVQIEAHAIEGGSGVSLTIHTASGFAALSLTVDESAELVEALSMLAGAE